MALSDSYADPELYKSRAKKTDNLDDSFLEDDLEAVSRLIDNELGRAETGFNRDPTPVARVFYPGTGRDLDRPFGSASGYPYGPQPLRWIDIPDMATADGLSIVSADSNGLFGATPWAPADYELFPLNAPIGPEPRPYDRIFVPLRASFLGIIPGTKVQVTACWGWPAVPKRIIIATVELTRLVRNETPRASRTLTEMGQVLGMSREASSIIERLKQAGLGRVNL